MLEVLSALTRESIAVFEDEELADAPVKALKKRLAQKLGIPRFRLRILQGNCPLDDNQTLIDDQTLTHTVVQLPPDREQDEGIIAASAEIMTSFLSSTWTSHKIPMSRMSNKQRRPHVRQPSPEVSIAYLYW